MKSARFRAGGMAGAVAVASMLWASAAAALDCTLCHGQEAAAWQASYHANTQMDVAAELAEEWSGQPPDSVITGSAAENCVACHGPTAVALNGGMSQVEVMASFFTTTDGVYSASTAPADTDVWPQVDCTACHDVAEDHPASMPTLAKFNSATAAYDPMSGPAVLCGQCHGALQFADTDHQLYDAWRRSRHGRQTQADVASELAEEWADVAPDSVAHGSEAEDCIACHGPTATKVDGGIDAAQALARFFTTTDGRFTAATTVADTADWPYVSCLACHDPHNPDAVSYFNSSTRSYEVMSSADQLCGQCHGNLRFPDTDHLSYNIEEGTGGVGVSDHVMMPGARCVDCHMASDGVEGSESSLSERHSWAVFTPAAGPGGSATCSACHEFSADSSRAIVAGWQTTYQELVAEAQTSVADAEAALQGSTDPVLLENLAEAQANLALAEGDESGGAHNAEFVQELLRDAIAKANPVGTAVVETRGQRPEAYVLQQNYPNPFNPSTTISFAVPRAARVRLQVFDLLGRRVRDLVDGPVSAGVVTATWDGTDAAGSQVASGVYLYRLSAAGFSATRQMLLMK